MTDDYKGNPRGSLWNKWDLHIHTPFSIIQNFGNSEKDETWEKYITALEKLPPEIKAIAINDYLFIDGYRRVIEYKNKGRLSNIELILPAIELRLTHLSGHKKTSKINFHIIFSDKLTPDDIETYFIKQLPFENCFSDYEWNEPICDCNKLKEFGKKFKENCPKNNQSNVSNIKTGFNNVTHDIVKINKVISNSIFKDKILTAIGLAEWKSMRWDSSAAIKGHLSHKSDLMFTNSPSPTKYKEQRESLHKSKVNNKLLDCSDAHSFANSNKPPQLRDIFSWIKADLTFQGLCRAVQCFDDRVFIGDIGELPPKLKQVQQYNRKYIQSIKIKKKNDSKLDETWFDCDIPINSDLVAIIGNQGNGKSALADIIALCGNTKTDEFSFLTKDKFCDNKNKASHFEATLTWEDGTTSEKLLCDKIAESDIERIRYVPQHFFEAVTNETTVEEGGKFYREIKKAIFSHIEKSDRLDCSDLDELLKLKTQENKDSIETLRKELDQLNSQIVDIEKDCTKENKDKLENEIEEKENEIKAHESNEPKKIEPNTKNKEEIKQIKELQEELDEIQKEIQGKNITLTNSKKQQEFLKQKELVIKNKYKEWQNFINVLQQEFDNKNIDVKANQLISIKINITSLTNVINEINNKIDGINQQLNPENQDGLIQRKQKVEEERKKFSDKLEQTNKEYDIYVKEYSKWETRLNELQGTDDTKDTLLWLKKQLQNIQEKKPLELEQLEEKRVEKSKEIYQKLEELISIHQDLNSPIEKYIKENPLTQDEYKIEFTIELVENIEDKLFDIIGYNKGTFYGKEKGKKQFQTIVNTHDFTSADGTIECIKELLDNLKHNHNNNPKTPIELSELTKKNKNTKDIYNCLFGLDYLSPQYALALDKKPLKQLSPGERGILLLIFYLIIDRGDEPLIIDQPEGNLNNKSIFENLVAVFKKAKNRRQIIIVTHNPNIAVVCDAEQIIHAEIDFQNGNSVKFESGALENPKFKQLSLDILEGTRSAFNIRKNTYENN